MGLLYYSPKTSHYCAKTSTLGTSNTVSILPRGFPETQQRRLIDSSDPRSVLPSPWQKLAREGLSVVPTLGWYLLTVNSCIEFRLDLQADKSPVVVKGPFFPRVVNPRYRIRGTNV
jgi:hypothetical protein